MQMTHEYQTIHCYSCRVGWHTLGSGWSLLHRIRKHLKFAGHPLRRLSKHGMTVGINLSTEYKRRDPIQGERKYRVG